MVVGGWFYFNKKNTSTPLKTQLPQFQNIAKNLEVSGIIDAEEKANLRFAAGGKLTYLRYKEGDAVKKGTAIATIDARELQKRLQQDLNTYMRERYDWEQREEDRKDTVTTNRQNRDMHKSQLDLNDTVLGVEIRDIAIQNTRLVSPINGILISSPTAVAGVNLMSTDAFEVVNPDTLVFKAAVDETDIGSVKIGQPVKIALDAYPDQPINSYIADIAYKSSQTTSGTVFVVKIPITGTNLLSLYRIGMNGDATITLDTRENVMTVPLDATKERDDKMYVTVKTGGEPGQETTEDREITIDLETDEYVEVLSGLKPEDEVVIPE
jgi:HlyD family secretion protein